MNIEQKDPALLPTAEVMRRADMNYPTRELVYQYLQALSNVAAEQWLQAADDDDAETAAWLEEVMDFFAAQKRAIARMSTIPYRAWCNWWAREIEPHMPALA